MPGAPGTTAPMAVILQKGEGLQRSQRGWPLPTSGGSREAGAACDTWFSRPAPPLFCETRSSL